MQLESLGLATDLALIATRGQVIDRGSYVVAITPDDPGYYYGNLLALPRPIGPGELPARLALFAREIGRDPAVRHVTLCWDGVVGDTGATDELIAAGFEIERMQGMTAHDLAAALPPAGIEVRPLAPSELVRTVELDPVIHGDPSTHRQFLHRRAAWQRDLIARGVAQFWGAFDDHALVASLGVVRLGRLGRYQDVQTAASHRRHGSASALVSAAGRSARARGVDELVIMTAAGSEAARVYLRLGFAIAEHTASACRKPTPVS
jgi:GNAT superfamily N-acetyltransferase